MKQGKLWASLVCLAIAGVAQPVWAQDDAKESDGQVSIGLTAGTLGVGPEVGYRFNETLGIRGGANFFSVNGQFDSDDLNYDGDVNLKSFGAIVDFYPFGGGFRVSAGARINNSEATLKVTPVGTVDVGGEQYTAEQIGTISGVADTKKFAPQLTIGYGGGLRSGLSFNIEAGALFQGAVRINQFTSTGTLSNDPTFRQSLEDERLSLQQDVDSYKVYPVLTLGLKYRF